MTALADLCSSVDYGYTATSSDDASAGPKFLRITDIVPEVIDWNSVPHCVIEDKKRKKFLLDSGDIVVARTGATVGYAKQVWVRPEGATFASYLVRFRPDPAKVDPYYLGQVVQSAAFKNWVKAVAGGAAQPNANAKLLGSFDVPLPEPEVQRKIGSALRSIGERIENNRRRIKILEDMTRLICRQWFVYFRFPGSGDLRLVDSELGPVPEGWQVLSIKQLQSSDRNATSSGPFGSKLGRKDYQETPGVPVIRGTNLRVGGGFFDEGFVFVSEEKAKTLSSSIARRGDLVVTQRGTLGQVGLIPGSSRFGEYVLSQSQMKFTANRDIVDALVVYVQLCTPEATQRLVNMATGAGVPHINLAMFRDMKFVIPPTLLQRSLVESLAPMIELTDNLVAQSEVLGRARELLLPRLVSGEIDVSHLDMDLEPVA